MFNASKDTQLVTLSEQSLRIASSPSYAPLPQSPGTPLALLRGVATVLPRPLLAALANSIVRGLERSHPRLLANLVRLDRAVIHIAPTDLPYRLALKVGCEPITLTVVDRDATGADAEVSATVATLVDLLEGRIDSDTLFFRRDLRTSGNITVVVALRNVLDRDEVNLADEIAALLGPLARPSRLFARTIDRVLENLGGRVAALHRTLHPASIMTESAISGDVERCRAEIAALTARLGSLEARQKRRDEKTHE